MRSLVLSTAAAALLSCAGTAANAAELIPGGRFLTSPALSAASTPTLSVSARDTMTIGYLTPAYGPVTLGVSPTALPVGLSAGLGVVHAVAMSSAFSAPTSVGRLGVFGGYAEHQSLLSLTPATAWSVGASYGYGGFYVRGGVNEAPAIGPLLGIQGLQAGFGYEVGAIDLRMSYLTSQNLGKVDHENDSRQVSIGGIYKITPRFLVNADAFYGMGKTEGTSLSVMTPPTAAPPGTGARVGVELRF